MNKSWKKCKKYEIWHIHGKDTIKIWYNLLKLRILYKPKKMREHLYTEIIRSLRYIQKEKRYRMFYRIRYIVILNVKTWGRN